MMQWEQVVAGRRSIKSYDRNHSITDDELKKLFGEVVLSPSSFNVQHWRFVVVRDPALKARLRKASFDQEQVETASAVIVVTAKLNAHEDAPEIFADAPSNVQK